MNKKIKKLNNLFKKKRNNGLNVVDFFCGCGGLSQGFREAGFKIKIGVDFNKSFLETYSYNFPEANVLNLDLSK